MANIIWEQRLIFYSAINSIYIHLIFVVVELQLRSLHCAYRACMEACSITHLQPKVLKLNFTQTACYVCISVHCLSPVCRIMFLFNVYLLLQVFPHSGQMTSA